MKKIKLKQNIFNPISLEIAPYMSRMFIPGEKYFVEDSLYNRYKEYYFEQIEFTQEEATVKTNMENYDKIIKEESKAAEAILDAAPNVKVVVENKKKAGRPAGSNKKGKR